MNTAGKIILTLAIIGAVGAFISHQLPKPRGATNGRSVHRTHPLGLRPASDRSWHACAPRWRRHDDPRRHRRRFLPRELRGWRRLRSQRRQRKRSPHRPWRPPCGRPLPRPPSRSPRQRRLPHPLGALHRKSLRQPRLGHPRAGRCQLRRGRRRVRRHHGSLGLRQNNASELRLYHRYGHERAHHRRRPRYHRHVEAPVGEVPSRRPRLHLPRLESAGHAHRLREHLAGPHHQGRARRRHSRQGERHGRAPRCGWRAAEVSLPDVRRPEAARGRGPRHGHRPEAHLSRRAHPAPSIPAPPR